jgi:hypothetical protein
LFFGAAQQKWAKRFGSIRNLSFSAGDADSVPPFFAASCVRNTEAVPSSPGLRKSNRLHKSFSRFSTGVPVSASR